jgi:hypothetical protein
VKSRALALCALAAFLVPIVFTARNLSTWPARLGYTGEESYEGVALAEMTRLGRGEPIYAAGAVGRFDAATYGPLYYILGKHVISLDTPSYLPLRLISVVGMLGCAAGCGLLAFWLTGSRMAAFLGLLVFLSYGMVTDHGLQALSDSAALFLFFVGFLTAYRFRDSRAVLLAAPIMILGFFMKPQYIAGPVAVVLFHLLGRQWRRAGEFAGLCALCGVSLFAYFQWVAFAGQAFWRHFLLYQASLFSWQRFGIALFLYALLFFIPLLFVIEYLRTSRNRMIACYLGAAIVLGLLTYSKSASGMHYFFETVFIVSTVVPALIAREFAKQRLPVDLLLVQALMLFAGQWSTKPAPRPADFQQHEVIQNYLRQNFLPGAQALGPAPGDLLQAGLRTPYAGVFQLTQLVHRGILSDRDLVGRIYGHEISVITLNLDVSAERNPYWLRFYLTAPMIEAIRREYVLATILDLPQPERERLGDHFYAYVPRSGP